MKIRSVIKKTLKEADIVVSGTTALLSYDNGKVLNINKIDNLECYTKRRFDFAIQELCNRFDFEKIKYKLTISKMRFKFPSYLVSKIAIFNFGKIGIIGLFPIKTLEEQIMSVDSLWEILIFIPFLNYYIKNPEGIKIVKLHFASKIVNNRRIVAMNETDDDPFSRIFEKKFGKNKKTPNKSKDLYIRVNLYLQIVNKN